MIHHLLSRSPRKKPSRQLLLPFQQKWLRRQRLFRVAILVITGLALAALLLAWPTGRSAVRNLGTNLTLARFSFLRGIGLEPDRAAIDASWRLRRQRGIEQTRLAAQNAYDRADPAFKHLLDVAGLKPQEALFRWGNYDLTFWFSSQVFEPDDTGRSYRLRPTTRAVWLRQLRLGEPNTGQLLVPDTPVVRQAAEAAGSSLLLDLAQTTNTWGCRGAEPDFQASLRGIVLGDSYMQGLLVKDHQTPPACLERELAKTLNSTVSILNTGVLAYSPEQYYHTLLAFEPRMKPQFVVVAPFANDVGNEFAALQGEGDWHEAAYWLGLIQTYCRQHDILCLITPVVCEEQLQGRRKVLGYPGRLADMTQVRTDLYLDPIEEFMNEELRLRGPNRAPSASPLYNGPLVDGHFSARGAALWGQVVANRLALLLNPDSP